MSELTIPSLSTSRAELQEIALRIRESKVSMPWVEFFDKSGIQWASVVDPILRFGELSQRIAQTKGNELVGMFRTFALSDAPPPPFDRERDMEFAEMLDAWVEADRALFDRLVEYLDDPSLQTAGAVMEAADEVTRTEHDLFVAHRKWFITLHHPAWGLK